MYVIGNIVYGWDLSEHNPTPFLDGKVEDAIDLPEELMEKGIMGEKWDGQFHEYIKNKFDGHEVLQNFYHGGDGQPLALGIVLESFDETYNFLVSDLKVKATASDKKKLKQIVKDLNKKQKEILSLMGEPQLFVIWSTS